MGVLVLVLLGLGLWGPHSAVLREPYEVLGIEPGPLHAKQVLMPAVCTILSFGPGVLFQSIGRVTAAVLE